MRVPSLLLIAVVSGLAVEAGAQTLELIDQTRTLEASSTSRGNLWDESQNPFFPDFHQPIFVYPVASSDDAAAPDFTPWTASVQTQDPALPLVPAPSGAAQASQDSLLSAGLIELSGEAQVDTDSYLMTVAQVQQIDAFVNPPVPFFFGTVDDTEEARSHSSVSFEVLESTPYTLTGALAWSAATPPPGSIPGDGVVQGFIELAEQGGAVLARTELDCVPDLCWVLDPPLDQSGTLAPGTYVFSAEIHTSGGGYCYDAGTLTCFMPSIDGSFDAQLNLGGGAPVPALGSGATLALALGLAGLGWRLTRRAAGPKPSGFFSRR